MNHYQTLGVSSDAKYDAIRAAYRSLAVKHHPDKGGDPLLFQAIQEAYEVLSDETKRREYNASFRKKPVESLSATAARMVDDFITAC
ncbi:MAG: J domain-containing protein [Verrucomicrobiaceae bacterium]|nr:MAG: J domain-containing protein [Verrucomicrobiaceae bacterium]